MGVSVIIPCRNQASTLERAVKSAFAAGADEVLVFDDASTDNTQEVLRGIKAQQGFGYNSISNFHSGVVCARNQLMKTSQINEWVIPLDADDELLFIPPVPADNCFIYGGWVEHYEDDTEETFTAPPYQMLNRKPLCHATMLFSKQQWQQIGGYDPDFFFGEDYAFQCALVNAGYSAIQFSDPLYKRYVGNNARTDKAIKYWPIIQEMAKEKYPAVFT